ncbi:unnamed protein product [Arabis nemorensis]|uniref:MATH domain-containing protein n=1 Tax=Arabis nemorensis TaxID=586526 RepID=A0A565BRR3_9BRAS|nr:unnamed protein product [Arabis nemorensis]
MGNEADNKFTWVIKNFSSLQSKQIYSDTFVIGGCKWRLLAYPKGNITHKISPNCKSALRRALRSASFIFHDFTVAREQRFDKKSPTWGFRVILPLTELQAKDGGFLVNGELKIVAEIDVLEVIGELDVSEEAESSTQPLKKMKLNVSSVESVDVSGFQVLPAQVESVKRIFEKYPDFASNLRSKNRHLKSTYMNVLLGLIETLCQSPQALSDDDLDEAFVAKGGFRVDWLEKMLDEVKAKKKKMDSGKARLQEMEEELQKYKSEMLGIESSSGEGERRCFGC